MENLYYNLSSYLRERFGKRLGKICIDAGFSCPNRDGKCGTGGCIFCGERGAGEHISAEMSVSEQVNSVLQSAGEDDFFIAYFQNFTNTYASVDVLKSRYDAALTDDRIKVLDIGTRPDCIDESIADLIAEYNQKREVWVELGLQSASDKTADLINRGYHRDAFENAVKLLNERNIKIVVHIIIGLPEESIEQFADTVNYLYRFNLFGIKVHSIYVSEGTVLADMYKKKLYTPPTIDEYIDMAVYAISHTRKDVVIHRLTGDGPRDTLLAPEWNKDKNAMLDGIRKKLSELSLFQGALIGEYEKQL